MTTETGPSRWIDVLAGSHDRICDLVGELDADALRQASYCADWSIAQVLSHLGSGAEIFTGIVESAVAGEPAPGREHMAPIWDRWNNLQPEEQAEEFLSTDGRLVETLENLGDRLDDLTFTLFGAMQLDAEGLVGMRLSEHAVHTWDVAVALDPDATVDPDAVALLVDRLPLMAGRAGRAEGAPGGLTVSIVTSDPKRAFALTVDSGVQLDAVTPGQRNGRASPGAEGGATSDGELRLPAEAFLRLVYGRLDPEHSPPLDAEASRLIESLRPVFPGF